MTISQILEPRGHSAPKAPALSAPGRTPLDYEMLHTHVMRTAASLRRAGIARDDTVAVVLPNGPEIATAFLSVATAAICAPLNPAYRAPELAFYLSDLPAKALLTAADLDSPAREVAGKLGIPVLEIASDSARPAGLFSIAGEQTADDGTSIESPNDNDVALVLHTSGTTSRPKIVPLTHSNLCASARHVAATLDLSPADRCLNVMPLFHIHGLVAGLLASLDAGGTVVCTPRFAGANFFDWFAEFRPTWYSAVPTMHRAILSRAAAHRTTISSGALRFVRSSSAALPRPTLVELEQTFGVPVIEAYGMTEAAHQMASNPLPPNERKAGTVGRAAGPEITVLDAEGRTVSPGVRGEIAIRGPNVTSGYLRNPEANAGAFTNGWLRTGDEGVLDDDGYLTILGRLKEVINRGGEKISPLEVDDALMAHPSVEHALTFSAPDASLGEEVAAAVVLRPKMSLSEQQLREFVGARLAHFKVPRRIVFLSSIPLGPTGKPQRTGLAERLGVAFEGSRASTTTIQHVAPSSAVEKSLAAIWMSLLRSDTPGVNDNFFYAGGDSALAAQFVARVRDTLNTEISLLNFFDNPTISRLARIVEEVSSKDRTVELRRNRTSAPLSVTQQMIWLATQLDAATPRYNRAMALRFIGDLDHNALQRALTEIVSRHEVLRSRIAMDGDVPVQHVMTIGTVAMPVVDVSGLPETTRNARLREILEEEARRPFDLAAGPLIRAGIVRSSDVDNTLFISTHHIASDGWSDGVLVEELQTLYGAFAAGEPSPLPALARHYSDFAISEREREDDGRERNAGYWRRQLAGAPVELELPTDRARPDFPTMAAGRVAIALRREVVELLESIGRSEGATLAMTMLAAFHVLLARLSGQSDIVAGVSISGRTRADTERLIGFFAGTLPVRVRIDREATFRNLLRSVRKTMLEAHDHQDVPVDVLLDALPSADGGRPRQVGQVLFNFRNMPSVRPSFPKLEVHSIDMFNGTCTTDLDLVIGEGGDHRHCELRYSSELYDASTASRLLGHFETVLEAIAGSPDQSVGRLPLLSEQERRKTLIEWNDTARPLPERLYLHELIETQARATPDAIALLSESGGLTYRELNGRANALAHELQSRGIRPGSIVAVCMERSLELIVSIVAVWKAGAAFVPLDTDHPPERLRVMLADCNPALVVHDDAGRARLGSHSVATLLCNTDYMRSLEGRDDAPPVEHEPDAIACVLYTSGSTGAPKGVLSTHRGIANNLLDMQSRYPLATTDRALQQTSLGFDTAAWEAFWPLTVGAQVYLARPGAQRDPDYLLRVLADEKITVFNSTPSTLHFLVDQPSFSRCNDIRIMTSAGEVLSPAIQNRILERLPDVVLANIYGPTEASITVTAWTCERQSTRRSVPIGRPQANVEIYILDDALEAVPIGVSGEIYIGGVAVSPGYLNRPELTAERFLPNPFRPENGGRIYRTGDIARFGPDGVIEYIGRRDAQLKIRGVRVEPAEIEASLDRLPAIRESAVVARDDGAGHKRIIAYVVLRDRTVTPIEIRRALERQLPAQFIPAAIIPLDSMPHNTNGKVDRPALPDALNAVPQVRVVDSPRYPLEERLAMLWREMLEISEVGINDSFFDLGGHSLLAVRMLRRVADELGESVSLRALYAEPTVAAMAGTISGIGAPGMSVKPPTLLKLREGKARPPLFYLTGQPAGAGLYAIKLRQYLHPDQPIYLVRTPIFDAPITAEGVAAQLLRRIRDEAPTGPYLLAGNCFGGCVALEMARMLIDAGERVLLVAILHPVVNVRRGAGLHLMRRMASFCGVPEEFDRGEFANPKDYGKRLASRIAEEIRHSTTRQRLDSLKKVGQGFGRLVARHTVNGFDRSSNGNASVGTSVELPAEAPGRPSQLSPEDQIELHRRRWSDALEMYEPRPYAGRLAILWPMESPGRHPWNPKADWVPLSPSLDWRVVRGTHDSMVREHLEMTARELDSCIEQALLQ